MSINRATRIPVYVMDYNTQRSNELLAHSFHSTGVLWQLNNTIVYLNWSETSGGSFIPWPACLWAKSKLFLQLQTRWAVAHSFHRPWAFERTPTQLSLTSCGPVDQMSCGAFISWSTQIYTSSMCMQLLSGYASTPQTTKLLMLKHWL